MLLYWSLCFRVTNSIVVNVPTYSLFTCTWIPCRDSHCESESSEVLCFHPRQLQQTVVSCKRSTCNKIENSKNKFVKAVRLRFLSKKRNTTCFPVLSCRFACILIHRLSLNHREPNDYELHQESLHCHQLEEELDDWCHCRYFQNGMGLSCCCPDSRCRRFFVDNASSKCERFHNGPSVSRLTERDPPVLIVSKIF